ncbi:MAG: hypothetical protein IPK76_16410 [Lewinellaceae bacterium]|nr:hypothetical protein [Lewinellaceae bacterium]
MKNIFFVVAIFTLAGFSNCEKNPLPPSPPDITVNPPVIELGKSFVLKNSEEWEVPFNAWFHSNPSRFQLRAEILYSNLVRESFFLHDIPCKKAFTVLNISIISLSTIPYRKHCLLLLTNSTSPLAIITLIPQERIISWRY